MDIGRGIDSTVNKSGLKTGNDTCLEYKNSNTECYSKHSHKRLPAFAHQVGKRNAENRVSLYKFFQLLLWLFQLGGGFYS